MWQGKESGKQSPGLGKGQERVRFFTAVSCPHPFHILLRAQETGIAAFNKKKKKAEADAHFTLQQPREALWPLCQPAARLKQQRKTPIDITSASLSCVFI